MKRIKAGVAALIAACIISPVASGQSYPSKPLKMVAPYATGGGADLMARYVCDKFVQQMGQPCVVENRTGAGGMIGVEFVVKAEADGHTLLMMPPNLPIIPGLYPKVPYDTVRDLAPIAIVSTTPIMIGSHPSVPAKNVQEFFAYVKSGEGKVNFTTCGLASPQHLAGEMLAAQGGFKWQHIPYKGCGAAFADVLAGTVPVFISTVAHFAPQIKIGKLRGYGVLGAQRTPLAPEYPTMAESGFPGFQVDVWFGLLASSKVPAPILARLNAEVNRALQSADMREKLVTGGYEPVGGTPERFAELIRSDMAKFGKVVRDIGIRPE